LIVYLSFGNVNVVRVETVPYIYEVLTVQLRPRNTLPTGIEWCCQFVRPLLPEPDSNLAARFEGWWPLSDPDYLGSYTLRRLCSRRYQDDAPNLGRRGPAHRNCYCGERGVMLALRIR
jgi:hypothetical protein